jgi:hypothetical protein
MPDVILWIYNYQLWIFGGLLVLCVSQLWLFWRRQNSLRFTVFNIERETLTRDRNIFLTLSFILVLLISAVLVSNFILAPNLTELYGVPPTPTEILPTETAAPTVTPELVLPGFETDTPEPVSGPAATRTTIPVGGSGCMFPPASITSPIPGAILAGLVEIRGTANIDNFAFYVIEVSTLGDNWLTVITSQTDAEGNAQPVVDGVLGIWNTGLMDPGDYGLRLIVYDSAGNHPQACTIPISIQSAVVTVTPEQ